MLKKISSYTIISIISSGIGFLSTIYLTRLLNPEEFAYIGIFLALTYFVTPILSFNSIGLVGINLIDLSTTQYKKFINTYLNFIILFSLILGMIISVISFIFTDYAVLLILTFIASVLVVFINIHNVELIQKSSIRFFGLYKISLGILNIISIFIFIQVLHMSWQGRLLGIIVSQSIIIIFMGIFSYDSIRSFKFKFNVITYKQYFIYGLPLVFGLGAAWLTTQLDKFIVLYFFDIKQLGYYSLGYTVGMSFVIINQSMVNAVAPRIYSILKDRNGKEVIFKYSLYYNILIVSLVSIAIIVFYFFGEFILGSKYINSLPIVLLVMVASSFDGMYRIYGLVINYFKENKLRTKIDYSIVILNIIFSIVLIPFFGIMAPAIGTIISYSGGFFFARYFAKIILVQRGVL